MRTIGISIVLTMVAAVVAIAGRPAMPQAPAAQAGPAAMKLFSSAADVQALLAKAKGERKEGQVMVAEPILSLAPIRYQSGIQAHRRGRGRSRKRGRGGVRDRRKRDADHRRQSSRTRSAPTPQICPARPSTAERCGTSPKAISRLFRKARRTSSSPSMARWS